MNLTVAIIARDEARHIDAAIASVAGLADEVLVLVDERSRDATAALATARGARVEHAAWRGFPGQRNLALARCRTPWILFLDADERVTPALADEVRRLLAAPGDIVGGWIPRENLFFGRIVRGGGWYPDAQLRLLACRAARYEEAIAVHEVATLHGPSRRLDGHLRHINIERFGELWRKQRAYALAEARSMAQAGRRARWRNVLGAPAREFWRRYVVLHGWRDGAVGLVLCATLAWYAAVSFVELARLNRHSAGSIDAP
jgi:(heptosyl)LPS beta-1,4-glucosyltransferase